MNRRNFLASGLAAATISHWPQSFTLGQNSSTKIKVGQIGTGHAHAAGKMEAVRRLTELYEVVGVCESDPKRRKGAEQNKTYAGLPWLDEAQLLAMADVPAVLIETEMADSAGAALRAIQAGKHIHLDKPGALQHDDFRRMRTAAEEKKLTVQMGYMLRYNPAFELLFRAVKENWLGDILEVDAMMGKLAGAGTRNELATLPGGGMFELACHVIDAMVTLLGKPDQVHAFTRRTREPMDKMADNQLAVLEYKKATATIRCNHADPFGSPRRRFQVSGTRGALEIMPLESGKLRLFLSEPHGDFKKGDQEVTLPVPRGRYDGEFIDLAKVIRGEKPLAWNAAHDLAVHETVLRASGAW